MEQIIQSKVIKEMFSKSGDILVRPVKINQVGLTISIFCVDGLINSGLVDEGIFQTMHNDPYIKECKSEREVMDYLLTGGTYHVFTKEERISLF
jgi:spore germination protein KA